MTHTRVLSLGAALLCLLCAGVAASKRGRVAFPHTKHERLFPVCQGCHAGVVSGAADERFPAPADCAECHDGTRVKRVDWRPPGAPRASNLRFSHVRHFDATARAGAPSGSECRSCHAADSGTTRMSVAGPPRPALCVRCHEHDADSHLAPGAACRTCHVPLAEAEALDLQRVARFPRPEWHRDDGAPDGFLARHGERARAGGATCAVCHARETCERCHANADRLPEVTALARDRRVVVLEVGKEAAYPVPATHRKREWAAAHGASARAEPDGCANCHTRPSCAACHLSAGGTSGPVVASLPGARAGAAPGVSPARMPTADVHPTDIKQRHGALATAGKPDCAECHAARQCAACHAAQESRAFHPPNFSERHAVDAFAGSGECQSCHRTETFCRSCHARAGVAAQGRMTAAFHTRQGGWVLSHGQAARLGLEQCAACHGQSDCLRCHSAAGGWGVNPHGPGFAASRMASRSGASCRLCHTSNPVAGK